MPVLHTLACLSTFNWLIASQTVFLLSPPIEFTIFAAIINILGVRTRFKLAYTPLGNSTHMAIPLQMTVTPHLSFTAFICTIYSSLFLMSFICMIYSNTIYIICTIYLLLFILPISRYRLIHPFSETICFYAVRVVR